MQFIYISNIKVTLNLDLHLNVIKRFSHTITTSTVTTISPEYNSTFKNTSSNVSSAITNKEQFTTSSTGSKEESLCEWIERSDMTSKEIINAPITPIETLQGKVRQAETPCVFSDNMNTNEDKSISSSSYESNNNYAASMHTAVSATPNILKEPLQHASTMSLPHSTKDIEVAVTPIIATCKLTSQAIVDNIDHNKTPLEDAEIANARQEALYHRIKEFVDSFGITKGVLQLGLNIDIAYTMYHIIRYRKIPLGNFIKGLVFCSISGAPSTIIINLPSNITPEAKEVVSTVATGINRFIEDLIPLVSLMSNKSI